MSSQGWATNWQVPGLNHLKGHTMFVLKEDYLLHPAPSIQLLSIASIQELGSQEHSILVENFCFPIDYKEIGLHQK